MLIGVAISIPFTYKTFVRAAKNHAIKNKVMRLSDFLDNIPRCHKNRADDIREHIKQNMDELDSILDGLRAIPRDSQFYGQVQETLAPFEEMQKEFHWRPSGKRADKTDK